MRGTGNIGLGRKPPPAWSMIRLLATFIQRLSAFVARDRSCAYSNMTGPCCPSPVIARTWQDSLWKTGPMAWRGERPEKRHEWLACPLKSVNHAGLQHLLPLAQSFFGEDHLLPQMREHLRGIEEEVDQAQRMNNPTRPDSGLASPQRRRAFATQGRHQLPAEFLILVIQVGLTEGIGELGDLLEARLHVFGDVL